MSVRCPKQVVPLTYGFQVPTLFILSTKRRTAYRPAINARSGPFNSSPTVSLKRHGRRGATPPSYKKDLDAELCGEITMGPPENDHLSDSICNPTCSTNRAFDVVFVSKIDPVFRRP